MRELPVFGQHLRVCNYMGKKIISKSKWRSCGGKGAGGGGEDHRNLHLPRIIINNNNNKNKWKWRLFPLILCSGITNRLSCTYEKEKVTYSISRISTQFFSHLGKRRFHYWKNCNLSNKVYSSRDFCLSHSKIKTQKARHKTCLDNGSHNNAQTPEEECKRWSKDALTCGTMNWFLATIWLLRREGFSDLWYWYKQFGILRVLVRRRRWKKRINLWIKKNDD